MKIREINLILTVEAKVHVLWPQQYEIYLQQPILHVLVHPIPALWIGWDMKICPAVTKDSVPLTAGL